MCKLKRDERILFLLLTSVVILPSHSTIDPPALSLSLPPSLPFIPLSRCGLFIHLRSSLHFYYLHRCDARSTMSHAVKIFVSANRHRIANTYVWRRTCVSLPTVRTMMTQTATSKPKSTPSQQQQSQQSQQQPQPQPTGGRKSALPSSV